ncbi:hypothetical protein NE237_028612 [Protea cynaroides]|uniref:Dof-type domain-containing protein n=1 Tax=Protea cynaroides TaxID=273540 RepID=A0A9Q0GQN9_9MAGN|nr:hypothetical protein NE237_028612 [Protea cynaroides]
MLASLQYHISLFGFVSVVRFCWVTSEQDAVSLKRKNLISLQIPRSKPRQLCKTCRRHWTKGGTLCNVPVSGSWKNKRPKTSSPSPHPVSGGRYPPSSSTSAPSDLSLALLNTPTSVFLHLPKASHISSLRIVQWEAFDGCAAFGGGADWVEVERP